MIPYVNKVLKDIISLLDLELFKVSKMTFHFDLSRVRNISINIDLPKSAKLIVNLYLARVSKITFQKCYKKNYLSLLYKS